MLLFFSIIYIYRNGQQYTTQCCIDHFILSNKPSWKGGIGQLLMHFNVVNCTILVCNFNKIILKTFMFYSDFDKMTWLANCTELMILV